MIDFSVRHAGQLLTSDVALTQAAEIAELVERPWDLEGRWVLREPELEIEWADTLVPLLQSVCVETIPSLVQTGHATAGRLTEYGYLRLDVEGDWIRVGGDDLPSGRVPRTAFLHGQLGAIGKLISLLTALGMEGFETRALKEDRRRAMEVLATAQWPDAHQALPPIPDPAPRRDAEGIVVMDPEGVGWRCGVEVVRLPGDRSFWVGPLVSTVLARLEAQQSSVLPFPGLYGYARFDAEGESVRVSGDGLADLRLPREGFLQTLRGLAMD